MLSVRERLWIIAAVGIIKQRKLPEESFQKAGKIFFGYYRLKALPSEAVDAFVREYIIHS